METRPFGAGLILCCRLMLLTTFWQSNFLECLFKEIFPPDPERKINFTFWEQHQRQTFLTVVVQLKRKIHAIVVCDWRCKVALHKDWAGLENLTKAEWLDRIPWVFLLVSCCCFVLFAVCQKQANKQIKNKYYCWYWIIVVKTRKWFREYGWKFKNIQLVQKRKAQSSKVFQQCTALETER